MIKVKCMLLRLNLNNHTEEAEGSMIQLMHNGRIVWPDRNRIYVLEKESRIKLDCAIDAELKNILNLELWQSNLSVKNLVGTFLINPTEMGGPFTAHFKNENSASMDCSLDWGIVGIDGLI